MIARLSDELLQELERTGDVPLRVENPRNHKVYVIVAEEQFSQSISPETVNGSWSEAKNARRFALIDKEIAGTISADEQLELQGLQQEIDEYLRRVAPLPLAQTRALHEQLRGGLENPRP